MQIYVWLANVSAKQIDRRLNGNCMEHSIQETIMWDEQHTIHTTNKRAEKLNAVKNGLIHTNYLNEKKRDTDAASRPHKKHIHKIQFTKKLIYFIQMRFSPPSFVSFIISLEISHNFYIITFPACF